MGDKPADFEQDQQRESWMKEMDAWAHRADEWMHDAYRALNVLRNLFIMAGANAAGAQELELPPPPVGPPGLPVHNSKMRMMVAFTSSGRSDAVTASTTPGVAT